MAKEAGAQKRRGHAMAELRDCDCDRSGPPRVFTPSLGCGDETAPVPVDPGTGGIEGDDRKAGNGGANAKCDGQCADPSHSAASDCAMIDKACARASRRKRRKPIFLSPMPPWLVIRR